MRLAIFGLALAVTAPFAAQTAEAANWGPNGHPEITFEVAIGGSFQLPLDVARVMALGSIAPDFFEFSNPAAHAQSPNPLVTRDGRRTALSREGYRNLQRQAFLDTRAWHRHYLEAAIFEMKRGHRERAAFLLGYAMHNSADLATHLLMSNLEHAALDRVGRSPDSDPSRLAKAHKLVRLDFKHFRDAIGPENWRLFRGEAVRRPGGTTAIVPEPLTVIGPGLETWDPRTGQIPGVGTSRGPLPDRIRRAVFAFAYRPDVQGRMPNEIFAKVLNFIEAMLPRQHHMAALLDHGLRTLAPRSVRRPAAMDVGDLQVYLMDVLDFVHAMPKAYEALSAAETQVLEDVSREEIWREWLAAELRDMRTPLEYHRGEISRLKAARHLLEEAIEAERAASRKLEEQRTAAADQERRLVEYQRPPSWERYEPYLSNPPQAPSPREPRETATTSGGRLRLPTSFGPGGFTW